MADQSLKACVDWLTRCSLLPRDHWLASGNAQLSDLIHQLKDGVLLCHLLIRLYPSAIDTKEFSQRPQMSQFLCLKNCRVFLQACRNVFKMKEEDLFDPHVLFNPVGSRAILHTLSVLSKTPLAQRSGIVPFTVSVNESCYKNISQLESENGDDDDDDDDDDEYGSYNSMSLGGVDDKIYGSLVEMNIKKDAQPKTKRDMCIQELVETEKKYVDVLDTIRKKFMKPLLRASTLLPSTEFEKIFFGIDKLWNAHTEFKSSLLRACESSSSLSIPDCFVTCKEKFLFYGEYCANLTLAQETIDRLCTSNPSLNAKVLELEFVANEGRFKMRDMLSIPMQRVLKYHLLLKELINNTKQDHPERKMLEKALEETQDLSLFVNEVKRDREMLSSISLVSSSINDLPKNTRLEENGRLLMDGEMKLRVSTENGIQTRHIFLFDKVMLICKSMKGETYSYKNALVLKYYEINPAVGKEKGLYGVVLKEISNKDSYMILAKKEEQIKKWTEVIRLAKDNENPQFSSNAKHDFKMMTFEKPTICDVCRKLLRGVFFQGYRCAKTSMNVHKECLRTAKDMDGPPTGTVLPKRPSVKSPGTAVLKVMKTISQYKGFPAPGFGRAHLSFDAGETIDVLSDNDPEWIEGELHGRRGFFPRSTAWDPGSKVSPLTPRPSPSPVKPTDYQNSAIQEEFEMGSHAWYAGMLSRDIAIQKLDPLPDGSYLVRISERASNIGDYAISIKADGKVMHMKVSKDQEGRFFLGPRTKFETLPQLVEYYQQVSLDKVYPELRTVLAIPFKNARRPGRRVVGHCVVKFDYSATEPTQLSLRTGEIIAILSKADESNGWWKGESRSGKIGIFPVTYVIEIEESQN